MDDARIEHTPTLFTVHKKGDAQLERRERAAGADVLGGAEEADAGFYVEEGLNPVMAPVSASLEFEGEQFAEVCVVGETKQMCRPVFE